MAVRSKYLIIISLLVAISVLLGGCASEEAAEPIIQTVVVTEVVEIEGEQVVQTQIVEIEVTPTPAPNPQGGTIIESTFADATILNPILSNDVPSSDIWTKMFLGLTDTDPFSGATIGQIAERWEASDDGLVFTFYLRDDIFWSDGEQVTAEDMVFTWDAIASELVETPRKSAMELIDSYEALDDFTLQVTFSDVDCTALSGGIWTTPLPSHKYAVDFSDIMESPENTAPSAVNGPFTFVEWIPESNATLASNANYYLGKPNVDGWIYRIFADQSAELAAILAGEVNVTLGVGPQYVSTIEGAIASGSQLDMKKYFNDGYAWIAMNQGNPENPQNGFVDENENGAFDEGEPLLEQDPHPILSDVAVRQAVSHAVDVTNIVNKVAFGQGAAIAANVLPAVGWAYNDGIAPYDYDLELAAQILEDAGWVDGDGDGVREKDGMTLSLKLQTNAGNETRENIIVIVQESLNGIGFDIDAEAVDFSSLVGELLSQTFDMVLLGWSNMGTDPDNVGNWEYRFDTVGSGFNFTSYYNESMEELGLAAKTLPGCDEAGRAAYYYQIQEMLHNEAPYVFLYNPLTNTVWSTNLQGVDPGPWSTYYNVEAWYSFSAE